MSDTAWTVIGAVVILIIKEYFDRQRLAMVAAEAKAAAALVAYKAEEVAREAKRVALEAASKVEQVATTLKKQNGSDNHL